MTSGKHRGDPSNRWGFPGSACRQPQGKAAPGTRFCLELPVVFWFAGAGFPAGGQIHDRAHREVGGTDAFLTRQRLHRASC